MHQQSKTRAAQLSIASNMTLIVLKLGTGIAMHSVSVISEAVHSGIDLIAALIAYFSIRESGKPADEIHRFGHGKIESLAATIEALLILAAAIFIIVEGVKKLVSGHIEVEQLGAGAAVMAFSALANFFVSRHLLKVARHTDSPALEGDAVHLRTDVYTSAGVLLGLVAIKLTGLRILDPIVAIGVAFLIIKTSFELAGNAMNHLLDARLPDDEEKVLHEVMRSFSDRCLGYHKLRTRKSGHVRQIDLHLVVPEGITVAAGHALSHEVIGEIRKRLVNSEVLVHIEPCGENCEECTLECDYRSTER